MKRMFLLLVSVLLVSSIAMADHIGVFTDASSCNCSFSPGFTTTVTIVHKYAAGATGSHFRVELPVGSSFFGFNTSFTTVGNLTTDLSVAYGTCKTGNFAIGTITAILGTGYITVLPAFTFADITYTNCLSVEVPANTGGRGKVGLGPCEGCDPLAAEPSTWGRVKSLYR